MTHRVTVKVAGLQPVQLLAALAGVAFIVFGVVGFSRTGVGDWSAQTSVLGFSVNPLHCLVFVAAGVLGLLMALGSGLARLYGWLLFAGFGALFVWDLMITGILARNPADEFGNPLAVNTNDNWLHLGIAIFGLLLAVVPARRKLVEEEDPVLPEPRSEAFRGEHDTVTPRDERVEPAVSPVAPTEPITQQRAATDPKTERVHTDRIKH